MYLFPKRSMYNSIFKSKLDESKCNDSGTDCIKQDDQQRSFNADRDTEFFNNFIRVAVMTVNCVTVHFRPVVAKN